MLTTEGCALSPSHAHYRYGCEDGLRDGVEADDGEEEQESEEGKGQYCVAEVGRGGVWMAPSQ